jgi:hypothetical protein
MKSSRCELAKAHELLSSAGCTLARGTKGLNPLSSCGQANFRIAPLAFDLVDPNCPSPEHAI